MQAKILQEFQSKIALAIDKGLIPNKKYKEIEFTVEKDGNVTSVEFWSSSKRLDTEHTVVKIPAKLQDQFAFVVTADFL